MTRARAIELLKEIQFCCDLENCRNAWDCDECVEAWEMAIEALEQEPKQGHWIDKGDFYVCSECGERMTYAVLGSEFSRAYAFMSDYCPHCGSAMEVESDGE